MNVYLASGYNCGAEFCLFRIVRNSSNIYSGSIKIEEVVEANVILVFRKCKDGFYQWRFENYDDVEGNWHDALVSSDDRIIELPDDKTALLWFKLEYQF